MYIVKVFDDTQKELCSFECNSLTESYDNEVQRKALTFRVNQNLENFIVNLTPLEGVKISKITIYHDEKEVITYTAYTTYSRASIEYPENNPNDIQGIINFAV